MGRTKKNGRTKPTNGRGRPEKYKPEFCEQGKLLCKEFGATHPQLAKFFSVNESTIRDWENNHHVFFLALREGRDQHDTVKVERSLLRRALGYTYEEVKVEDVMLKVPTNGRTKKNGNGNGKVKQALLPATKITTTTKKICPSVTACIFWLINRSRAEGRWQHVQTVQIGGGLENDIPPELDISKLTREELEQLRDIVARAAETAKRGDDRSGAVPAVPGQVRPKALAGR